MTDHWNMQTLTDVRDKEIYSSDGEKIGSVRDIYYDDTTREPEWIGIGTGFLGMQERLVPVQTLEAEGEHFRVPFTKDQVKNEPDFKIEDGRLSNADEMKLCQHFGVTGEHNHSMRMHPYGAPFADID
jgi:sporulation protein YlmC with PRC-barrel domain